jgi:hypothetical protein
MLVSNSEIKTFALTKNNFISVSIEMPKVEQKESNVKSHIKTPVIQESKEIVLGKRSNQKFVHSLLRLCILNLNLIYLILVITEQELLSSTVRKLPL